MHESNGKLEPEPATTDGKPQDRCSVCGEAIDTTEWHPIRGRTEDGNFRIYQFCSDDCFEQWEHDESKETD